MTNVKELGYEVIIEGDTVTLTGLKGAKYSLFPNKHDKALHFVVNARNYRNCRISGGYEWVVLKEGEVYAVSV